MSLERRNVIFHIDVNSAFLSWEAVYRLHHLGGKEDLRKRCLRLAVIWQMRHGIILAKSIPAKKFHIKTGETILEAKQKCPELILVPPNYNLYEKCSKGIYGYPASVFSGVEQYSVDEAFVGYDWYRRTLGRSGDGGLQNERPDPGYAGIYRQYRDLGDKLLAKMASDFQKPDRCTRCGIMRLKMKCGRFR